MRPTTTIATRYCHARTPQSRAPVPTLPVRSIARRLGAPWPVPVPAADPFPDTAVDPALIITVPSYAAAAIRIPATTVRGNPLLDHTQPCCRRKPEHRPASRPTTSRPTPFTPTRDAQSQAVPRCRCVTSPYPASPRVPMLPCPVQAPTRRHVALLPMPPSDRSAREPFPLLPLAPLQRKNFACDPSLPVPVNTRPDVATRSCRSLPLLSAAGPCEPFRTGTALSYAADP